MVGAGREMDEPRMTSWLRHLGYVAPRALPRIRYKTDRVYCLELRRGPDVVRVSVHTAKFFTGTPTGRGKFEQPL